MPFKFFDSKRTFGVELEVNTDDRFNLKSIVKPAVKDRQIVVTGWDQSSNNNYWHIKSDSTCGYIGKHRDYGSEVVSFKAVGWKDLNEITLVAKTLQEAKVDINENCGLHVHVGIEDFSDNDVGILLARWMKIENIFCQMLPSHRIDNLHCKLWSKKKLYRKNKRYTALEIWQLGKPKNLAPSGNKDKRMAINFVNYQTACLYGGNRKTVELRLPEGTVSPEDVASWVRLFVNFVDVSKTSPMPLSLRQVSNLNTFYEYFGLNETTLSRGLYNTRLWILKRMNKFGSNNFIKLINTTTENL